MNILVKNIKNPGLWPFQKKWTTVSKTILKIICHTQKTLYGQWLSWLHLPRVKEKSSRQKHKSEGKSLWPGFSAIPSPLIEKFNIKKYWKCKLPAQQKQLTMSGGTFHSLIVGITCSAKQKTYSDNIFYRKTLSE